MTEPAEVPQPSALLWASLPYGPNRVPVRVTVTGNGRSATVPVAPTSPGAAVATSLATVVRVIDRTLTGVLHADTGRRVAVPSTATRHA